MRWTASPSAAFLAIDADGADPVVSVSGELDPPRIAELEARVCEADLLQHGRRVIIDLGRVTRCPAAAARALYRFHDASRERGIEMRMRCRNETVRHVLELAGLRLSDADETNPAAHDQGLPEAPTCAERPREAASERREQRAETARKLERMACLEPGDPERARLRERVIADHMNYARHLARRFAGGRGSGAEDLEQVAYLGLVRAVENFDAGYGTGFLAYATPVILGEIRRHFRDATWAVHVPRGMQEMTGAMYRAKDHLCAELGREATIGELAGRLEVDEDVVVAMLDAAGCYRIASLDRPAGYDPDAAPLVELIGAEDPGFERAVDHEVLRTLIVDLSERDKKILLMRFFRGMTQSEIGEEIGVSQMQVSRIIDKLIKRLRAGFRADDVRAGQ